MTEFHRWNDAYWREMDAHYLNFDWRRQTTFGGLLATPSGRVEVKTNDENLKVSGNMYGKYLKYSRVACTHHCNNGRAEMISLKFKHGNYLWCLIFVMEFSFRVEAISHAPSSPLIDSNWTTTEIQTDFFKCKISTINGVSIENDCVKRAIAVFNFITKINVIECIGRYGRILFMESVNSVMRTHH